MTKKTALGAVLALGLSGVLMAQTQQQGTAQGNKPILQKALKHQEKAMKDRRMAHKAGWRHPIKNIKYRMKADRQSDKAHKDLRKAAKKAMKQKAPAGAAAPAAAAAH